MPSTPFALRNSSPPPLTPGRAALVGLMRSYLGGSLDPFVTLLEVQKLMYFLQESAGTAVLRYRAGYGPYAVNLRHVLDKIEGHLITGSGNSGDAPTTQLSLVPGAVAEVERFLADRPAIGMHFDRVVDLVQGFETPSGLELLATVHWVAKQNNTSDLRVIVAKVYAWNERKRLFSPRQLSWP